MSDHPIQDIVLKHIKMIEEEHNVKVIFACESGSRAWGFASATSDYDVRFIYVRRFEDYFKLGKKRDVIDREDYNSYDPLLDLGGWDITKFAEQALRSNTQILEWLNSPIIYYMEEDFFNYVSRTLEIFNRHAVMHHYVNHARRINEERLRNSGEKTLAKSYLYTMRCLIMLISLKTYERFPLWIDINQLIENRMIALTLGEDVVKHLQQLIDNRKNLEEKSEIERIPDIEKAIEYFLKQGYEWTDSTPDVRINNEDKLQKLVVGMIRKYDHE